MISLYNIKFAFYSTDDGNIRFERTLYASPISLNFRSASTWLPRFLSGCHFLANNLYLEIKTRISAKQIIRINYVKLGLLQYQF